MINLLSSMIPLCASVVAIVLSILSYNQSKKQVTSSILPEQRLDWMSKLRANFSEFISIYLEEGNQSHHLLLKKIDILLLLNVSTPLHQPLVEGLTMLINNNEGSIEELALQCRKILDHTWKQVKLEAQLTWENEKAYSRHLQAKIDDLNKIYQSYDMNDNK